MFYLGSIRPQYVWGMGRQYHRQHQKSSVQMGEMELFNKYFKLGSMRSVVLKSDMTCFNFFYSLNLMLSSDTRLCNEHLKS